MKLTSIRAVLRPAFGRGGLTSTNRGREQEFAPEFVFQRQRIGVPPGMVDVSPEQPAIRQLRAPVRVYRRFEHLESAFSNVPDLRMDVPPLSLVSISGTQTRHYTLALWAEAGGASEEQARALVEQIELTWERNSFALSNSPGSSSRDRVFYFDVVGPADRPVTITGTHAAIDVFGIRAPVRISSARGRVSVLETFDDIEVTATHGGCIVWAGERGRVRLDADLGIQLKMTERVYDGTLEATSGGSIHVVLPRQFVSGFEVNVAGDDRFICRADIRSQFQRRQESARVLFSYGSGQPVMRLVSLEGSTLIDNTPAESK